MLGFFYKEMLLRISTVKTYNIDNCLTSKKINKMKLLMITLMDTVKVIIVNIWYFNNNNKHALLWSPQVI